NSLPQSRQTTYVPVCAAAPDLRCPRLLVRGKLMRLCQHPNNASKMVTFSSKFFLTSRRPSEGPAGCKVGRELPSAFDRHGRREYYLLSLLVTEKVHPFHRPPAFSTKSGKPDRISCSQYLERRKDVFVALRILKRAYKEVMA